MASHENRLVFAPLGIITTTLSGAAPFSVTAIIQFNLSIGCGPCALQMGAGFASIAVVDGEGLNIIPNSDNDDGQLTSEQLLPIVYEELRKLASARMAQEAGGHTLQPTALVHEAWLRLSGNGECSWRNQGHFFGAAALAMRRILVDRSRRKAALKRQAGEALPVSNIDDLMVPEPGNHILLIHESLTRLEQIDPAAAQVVLLKFFSGLSSEEIARMSGSSTRSVERQWMLARTKLYQMIHGEGSQHEGGSP